VIDQLLEAAPLALLFSLPVAGLGALVVLRLRRSSLTATMVALVLVPLLAALAGIVAVSGFMYTPQLAGTVAVCLVVAAVTVPAGMLLGRAVGREAMWLSEARAAERRSEEARRRLVAGMSHDLRSPLAGIAGMTDAVLDGVVRDPAEVRDYLARVRRETTRMTSMVEDLFEVSRATSGTLDLTLGPLALAEAASDAVGALAGAARAAGVDVRADDPVRWPTVLGSDPDLTRVLRNVLGNAVRHTSPGGVVRLSARAADGVARLHVDDACGGIPADDLPRLFDIGYRGAAARTPTAQSGAGLGLAIARGLMEAQGGGITITNHGPGCRVEIVLPLAPAGAAAPVH
jgi:signal transduction histidine kinase